MVCESKSGEEEEKKEKDGICPGMQDVPCETSIDLNGRGNVDVCKID